jgi:hypothetical protein
MFLCGFFFCGCSNFRLDNLQMTSWRKTVSVRSGGDCARWLAKVHVIKPAVKKGKTIIKPAVTKP